MLATLITNHVEQALGRFMQQYKNIPARYFITLPITNETIQVSALFSIMAALVDQVQALENAAYSIDAGRQLFNGTGTPAVGVQLDNLGTLFNIPRNGLSDAEYIVFIFGTIAQNNSDTTITTMTNIASLLFQVQSLIALELFPAEFDFQIPNTTPLQSSLFSTVAGMLQNSLGAGIRLGFISTYPANPFRCAFTLPVLVTSGTVAAGNSISGLASVTGLSNGLLIQGGGFPAGTTISNVSGTTVTASKSTTETGSFGFTFGGQNIGGGFGDLNAASIGGGLAQNIYNSVNTPIGLARAPFVFGSVSGPQPAGGFGDLNNAALGGGFASL